VLGEKLNNTVEVLSIVPESLSNAGDGTRTAIAGINGVVVSFVGEGPFVWVIDEYPKPKTSHNGEYHTLVLCI
jgi:hypothetical protein